jgi:hypothetical protein
VKTKALLFSSLSAQYAICKMQNVEQCPKNCHPDSYIYVTCPVHMYHIYLSIYISSVPNVQQLWGPFSVLSEGSFLGEKRPERESDLASPSCGMIMRGAIFHSPIHPVVTML